MVEESFRLDYLSSKIPHVFLEVDRWNFGENLFLNPWSAGFQPFILSTKKLVLKQTDNFFKRSLFFVFDPVTIDFQCDEFTNLCLFKFRLSVEIG